MSEVRESWIFTTRMTGVGCGKLINEFETGTELQENTS